VRRWKQSGRIHFWRYLEGTRRYPGWHLALDAAGHGAFCDLLERLAALDCAHAGSATVAVSAPTEDVLDVPNNPRRKVIAPAQLKLVVPGGSARQWKIEEGGSETALTIDRTQVAELRDWLRAPGSAFDCVFGGEPGLWFWGLVD
jgi:hypothetical protein